MRKVIGIGETILDIIFRNEQPSAAVPGGSVFNGIVSLSRTGVPVCFISETGNDHVGNIILRFMRDNHISTDYVNVFPDGKSPVSLAFLDDNSTVRSESYPLEIKKIFPDIQVTGMACPMWVPLVENKEYDGDGADYFVKKYIDTILQKDPDIDTLILGCTHYPLLLQKIRQYTPSHIRLVTQGEYVSESLKDYLLRHPDMDARCSKNKRREFLTTESVEKFRESASVFLHCTDVHVRNVQLE